MKRIRKWLIRIGIVLIALVVILVAAGFWFVRRPWPEVSGTLNVSGLLTSVEILRDQWGVPNIYAQNEHDLFFAQGYVHAQDRLWQMEVIRRFCRGTSSEILGEVAVEADEQMRTLGTRQVAERSWQLLDEDSHSILEAYAEGVNAYMDTHRDRLPIEFTILGVTPEPWTPVDSLLWGNMLAKWSSFNASYELLRAKYIAKFGEETASQIFPLFYKVPPTSLPAELSNMDWQQTLLFEEPAPANMGLVDSPAPLASNSWVVHESRTQTGKPLLANDPHLVFWMPLDFYENGLHGGRFNSIGFTFPGAPLIFIGHNQDIAWGVTNLNADVQDLYIEKVNDLDHPTQYEFMGQWYDIDITHDQIAVKGQEPVKFDILRTRHGPLVKRIGHLDWFTPILEIPDKNWAAFHWNMDQDSLAFQSIKLLNLASNWDEFRAALQYWDTLSENFTYADVKGNIGYQAAGRIPIRVPGDQGTVPVPGWTGTYEWQGFIPFDKLPSVLNPPAGFIVTANNKVAGDDYPYFLTYEYDPGYRAKRISELLSAGGDHLTLEDMQRIQADTYSEPAKILSPYLLEIKPENDLQAKALTYVKTWDMRYTTDSVGATVFEAWLRFLVQNTVADEYGGWIKTDFNSEDFVKQVLMMIELMPDPTNHWFDNTETPQVETRDDIARQSLTEAINWLKERYGEDPSQWQWGKIQSATFYHFPLGSIGVPLVESIFNSQSVPVSGSQFSVHATAYWYDTPFNAAYGAAFRMIADLGNWDNSVAVLGLGQSAHLFHPHRDDQLTLWQKDEYRPMPFSRAAVEKYVESTLTLAPQSK